MTAMSESNNGRELPEHSTLERLPAEIRNHIYALVVVREDHLDLTIALRQPGLAATNSEIRAEVLPVFYGANVFMWKASMGRSNHDKRLIEQYAKDSRLMKGVGAYLEFWEEEARFQVLTKGDGTLECTFKNTVEGGLPVCACLEGRMDKARRQGTQSDVTLATSLLQVCALCLGLYAHQCRLPPVLRRRGPPPPSKCYVCQGDYRYVMEMSFR